MPEPQEVFDQVDKVLDTQALREAKLLSGVLVRLRQRATNAAAKLEMGPDGKLRGPKFQLKQAQALHEQYVQMFAERYMVPVGKMLDDRVVVDRQIQTMIDQLELSAAWTTADAQMMESLRQQSYRVHQSLSDRTVDEIMESVYTAVGSGEDLQWLTEQIEGRITGYQDVTGRPLNQYAETYAHDSLQQYYRQGMETKAQAAGLVYRLYTGNIVTETRPFCVARAGQPYHVEEIADWTHSWSGKSGPALTHCGGYRCRHHWQPVKERWLKQGRITIQSAKEPANMTAAERKELSAERRKIAATRQKVQPPALENTQDA